MQFLGKQYALMGYQTSHLVRHGSVFTQHVLTKFDADKTASRPARYLDVPPSTTARLLTHDNLLAKFCFKCVLFFEL